MYMSYVGRGHCRIVAAPNPITSFGNKNMFKPKQLLEHHKYSNNLFCCATVEMTISKGG